MVNKIENPIIKIDAETLLGAYKKGLFPMAENSASPDVFWVDPENRGIIKLSEAKIPKRLKRFLKKKPFDIKINTKFESVVDACAKSRPGRESTWINSSIKNVYLNLHKIGYAHSIECFENNILIGGLYGVSIGAVFFGESMFSFKTDASKVALIHLIERLRFGNFMIVDTQFFTKHLKIFGAKEIMRNEFMDILKVAIKIKASFFHFSSSGSLEPDLYPTGKDLIV